MQAILWKRMVSMFEHLESSEDASFQMPLPKVLYSHTIETWYTAPNQSHTKVLQDWEVLRLNNPPLLVKSVEKVEALKSLLQNLNTLIIKSEDLEDWKEWIQFTKGLNIKILDFDKNLVSSSFPNLIQMTQACKELTSISINTSVFEEANAKEMECFFQSCSLLTTLSLRDVERAWVSKMQPYFEQLQELRYLKISYETITPESVQYLSELIQNLPHLKSLSLNIEHPSKSQEAVYQWLLQVPPLTSLMVAGFDFALLPKGMLKEIFSRQPTLKYLSFPWMKIAEDEANWDEFCMSVPASIVSLDMYGAGFLRTGTSVVKLLWKLPNLVHLDMSDSTIISALSVEELKTIFDGLPKLKSLSFDGVYLGDWKVAEFLQFKNHPHIQHLKLTNAWLGNLWETDLEEISECLSHLKTLIIHGETNNFKKYSSYEAFLSKLWNLELINVSTSEREKLRNAFPEMSHILV